MADHAELNTEMTPTRATDVVAAVQVALLPAVLPPAKQMEFQVASASQETPSQIIPTHPIAPPNTPPNSRISGWSSLATIKWSDAMANAQQRMRYGIWGPRDKEWLPRLCAMYESAVCAENKHLLDISNNNANDTATSSSLLSSSSLSASASSSIGEEQKTNHACIPRIVHQIWLGSPVPSKFSVWRKSWTKYNPESVGWRYQLHGDTELESLFPYSRGEPYEAHLRALMSAATCAGERSDIFRLDILLHFGGVYVDTDFECLAPFEWLHAQSFMPFYVGVGNTNTPELSSGIIASRPNHPFLVKLVTDMKLPTPPPSSSEVPLAAAAANKEFDPMEIVTRTGPGHLTRCFMDYVGSRSFKHHGDNADVLAFPVGFFYPLSNALRHVQFRDRSQYYRPETLAVHHFARSWIPQHLISRSQQMPSW